MSKSNRTVAGDRPTLRLIKDDAGVAAELQRLEDSPLSVPMRSVWRREAVAAYELAEVTRRHLVALPSHSEFAGHLADRADDYEMFAGLRGVRDGSDRQPEHGTRPDFVKGRAAAARAVADAYARALELVDPDDVDERDWYLARLRDARTIAGMPTVAVAGGSLA